jgi:hypothetical protein
MQLVVIEVNGESLGRDWHPERPHAHASHQRYPTGHHSRKKSVVREDVAKPVGSRSNLSVTDRSQRSFHRFRFASRIARRDRWFG